MKKTFIILLLLTSITSYCQSNKLYTQKGKENEILLTESGFQDWIKKCQKELRDKNPFAQNKIITTTITDSIIRNDSVIYFFSARFCFTEEQWKNIKNSNK